MILRNEKRLNFIFEQKVQSLHKLDEKENEKVAEDKELKEINEKLSQEVLQGEFSARKLKVGSPNEQSSEKLNKTEEKIDSEFNILQAQDFVKCFADDADNDESNVKISKLSLLLEKNDRRGKTDKEANATNLNLAQKIIDDELQLLKQRTKMLIRELKQLLKEVDFKQTSEYGLDQDCSRAKNLVVLLKHVSLWNQSLGCLSDNWQSILADTLRSDDLAREPDKILKNNCTSVEPSKVLESATMQEEKTKKRFENVLTESNPILKVEIKRKNFAEHKLADERTKANKLNDKVEEELRFRKRFKSCFQELLVLFDEALTKNKYKEEIVNQIADARDSSNDLQELFATGKEMQRIESGVKDLNLVSSDQSSTSLNVKMPGKDGEKSSDIERKDCKLSSEVKELKNVAEKGNTNTFRVEKSDNDLETLSENKNSDKRISENRDTNATVETLEFNQQIEKKPKQERETKYNIYEFPKQFVEFANNNNKNFAKGDFREDQQSPMVQDVKDENVFCSLEQERQIIYFAEMKNKQECFRAEELAKELQQISLSNQSLKEENSNLKYMCVAAEKKSLQLDCKLWNVEKTVRNLERLLSNELEKNKRAEIKIKNMKALLKEKERKKNSRFEHTVIDERDERIDEECRKRKEAEANVEEFLITWDKNVDEIKKDEKNNLLEIEKMHDAEISRVENVLQEEKLLRKRADEKFRQELSRSETLAKELEKVATSNQYLKAISDELTLKLKKRPLNHDRKAETIESKSQELLENLNENKKNDFDCLTPKQSRYTSSNFNEVQNPLKQTTEIRNMDEKKYVCKESYFRAKVAEQQQRKTLPLKTVNENAMMMPKTNKNDMRSSRCALRPTQTNVTKLENRRNIEAKSERAEAKFEKAETSRKEEISNDIFSSETADETFQAAEITVRVREVRAKTQQLNSCDILTQQNLTKMFEDKTETYFESDRCHKHVKEMKLMVKKEIEYGTNSEDILEVEKIKFCKPQSEQLKQIQLAETKPEELVVFLNNESKNYDNQDSTRIKVLELLLKMMRSNNEKVAGFDFIEKTKELHLKLAGETAKRTNAENNEQTLRRILHEEKRKRNALKIKFSKSNRRASKINTSFERKVWKLKQTKSELNEEKLLRKKAETKFEHQIILNQELEKQLKAQKEHAENLTILLDSEHDHTACCEKQLREEVQTRVPLEKRIETAISKINLSQCAADALDKSLVEEKKLGEVEKELFEEPKKASERKIKHEQYQFDETNAQKLTEETKKKTNAEKSVDYLIKLLEDEEKLLSSDMAVTLAKLKTENTKRRTAEQKVAELTELLKIEKEYKRSVEENERLEEIAIFAENTLEELGKEVRERINAENKIKKTLLEGVETKTALETQIKAMAGRISVLECAGNAVGKSLEEEKRLRREVEKKLIEEQKKVNDLKNKQEQLKLDKTTAEKLTEDIKKRTSAEQTVDDLKKQLKDEKIEKQKLKILAERKLREMAEILEKLENETEKKLAAEQKVAKLTDLLKSENEKKNRIADDLTKLAEDAIEKFEKEIEKKTNAENKLESVLLEGVKTKEVMETQIEAMAGRINALECAGDAVEKSFEEEKQLRREVEKKLIEEQIKVKILKIKHEQQFKLDKTTAKKLTEEIKKRISAEKHVDDLEELLEKEEKTKEKFKILAESKSREIVETLEKLDNENGRKLAAEQKVVELTDLLKLETENKHRAVDGLTKLAEDAIEKFEKEIEKRTNAENKLEIVLLEGVEIKEVMETQIEAMAGRINALECAGDAVEKSFEEETQLKREIEKKLIEEQIKVKNLKIKHEQQFKLDKTTAQKLTEEIKQRISAEQTVDDLKKQLQDERQRSSRAMIETLSKSENERAKRQTEEQKVAELTDLLKKENMKLQELKKLAEDAIKKLQKENHSRISAEQKVEEVLTLLNNKNDELIELKKDLLQERKFINEITLIIENEHREHQEDGHVLEVKSEAMLSNIFSSSFELKPIDTSFEKKLRADNNRIYEEEQKISLTKRNANRVDTAINHDISQAQQNFVNTYKGMLAEEIKKRRSAQNTIENLLQLLEDEINKVEKLELVVMRKSKLLTKTLTMLKNKEANRQADTVQIHDAATQFCKEKRGKESCFIDNQRREKSLKLVEDAIDESKEKIQTSSTANRNVEETTENFQNKNNSLIDLESKMCNDEQQQTKGTTASRLTKKNENNEEAEQFFRQLERLFKKESCERNALNDTISHKENDIKRLPLTLQDEKTSSEELTFMLAKKNEACVLLKHRWSAEKPEAAVETEFQSDSYSKEMENLKLMLKMETEWRKISEEKLEVERKKFHEQQSYQLQQIQLAETEIWELLRLFRMKIAINKGNESYIQDSSCIRVLESLLKMRSNKDDASDIELEINIETNQLLQEHAGETTKKTNAEGNREKTLRKNF